MVCEDNVILQEVEIQICEITGGAKGREEVLVRWFLGGWQ